MGENSATKACVHQNSRLFEYFKQIDNYFGIVDKHLCVESCPCIFTNESAVEEFQQNANFFYEYNKYKPATSIREGVIQIQNCPDCFKAIKNEMSDDTWKELFGELTEESFKQFATYWGRIEEKFKCTSWCNKSYVPDAGKPSEIRYFYKYIFSDINMGPVRNTCMGPVIRWIKKTLKAYGGLTMIIYIIQGFLFALSFTLLFNLASDSKSQRTNEEIYPNAM